MPTCGLSAKVDPEQFQSHSIFRLCSWVLTKGEEEAGLIAGSCWWSQGKWYCWRRWCQSSNCKDTVFLYTHSSPACLTYSRIGFMSRLFFHFSLCIYYLPYRDSKCLVMHFPKGLRNWFGVQARFEVLSHAFPQGLKNWFWVQALWFTQFTFFAQWWKSGLFVCLFLAIIPFARIWRPADLYSYMFDWICAFVNSFAEMGVWANRWQDQWCRATSSNWSIQCSQFLKVLFFVVNSGRRLGH